MRVRNSLAIALIIGATATWSPSAVVQADYSFTFTKNLAVGSQGADVSALQQFLIDNSFLTSISAPTGYFGNGTQAALIRFQIAHNISPASGYFGTLTRAAVNSLDGGSLSEANSQVQTSQTSETSTSLSLTPSLISQIEPAIPVVVCFPPDYSTSGEFVYGSGVSIKFSDGVYIETNYHVYNEANTGGGLPTCYAAYPEPPYFSSNASYGVYKLTLHGYHYDLSTYEDVADFSIGAANATSTPINPIPTINDASLVGIGSDCSSVQVGDGVHVFGYPSSGNALEMSETVTQGTIAGILPGPIYKFNGTIDHGNSGGLAVLDKNACALGIPTMGSPGLTGGIGYIQSFALARQPVTESNDQICQDDYGTNSVWSGTKNSQGGLICGCASGYTWNSSNTACVSAPSGYQVCSAAYPNETWDGTYSSTGKYNCVCLPGYTLNSSQTGCVLTPTCPPFSSYNFAANQCQCLSGYQAVGGVCELNITYCQNLHGFGATYDASTNSCACSYGYVNSGGQCVSGYLYCMNYGGIGDSYNSLTGKCTCMAGYYWNGAKCVSSYTGY